MRKMHATTTNLSFTVPVSTNSNATNKLTNRQTEPNQLQPHPGQQNDDDSEMADCDTEEEVNSPHIPSDALTHHCH